MHSTNGAFSTMMTTLQKQSNLTRETGVAGSFCKIPACHFATRIQLRSQCRVYTPFFRCEAGRRLDHHHHSFVIHGMHVKRPENTRTCRRTCGYTEYVLAVGLSQCRRRPKIQPRPCMKEPQAFIQRKEARRDTTYVPAHSIPCGIFGARSCLPAAVIMCVRIKTRMLCMFNLPHSALLPVLKSFPPAICRRHSAQRTAVVLTS